MLGIAAHRVHQLQPEVLEAAAAAAGRDEIEDATRQGGIEGGRGEGLAQIGPRKLVGIAYEGPILFLRDLADVDAVPERQGQALEARDGGQRAVDGVFTGVAARPRHVELEELEIRTCLCEPSDEDGGQYQRQRGAAVLRVVFIVIVGIILVQGKTAERLAMLVQYGIEHGVVDVAAQGEALQRVRVQGRKQSAEGGSLMGLDR